MTFACTLLANVPRVLSTGLETRTWVVCAWLSTSGIINEMVAIKYLIRPALIKDAPTVVSIPPGICSLVARHSSDPNWAYKGLFRKEDPKL